jgi:hypothetical protein
MAEKINIITSFFVSKLSKPNIEARNNELVEALRKNVESPYVETIHLFVDDSNSLDKLNSLFTSHLECGKIVIASSGNGMALYYDFFNYALNTLKGKICMVTNSDIYIHECDMNLIYALKENSVYALTRHEYDMSCPLINDYHGSHDSFIFRSPLSISIDELKFPQNVWGSEAKLLSILYNQNIIIKNPCRQIKIVHLHQSNIREDNRPWIAYHTPDNPAVNHPPIHIDA